MDDAISNNEIGGGGSDTFVSFFIMMMIDDKSSQVKSRQEVKWDFDYKKEIVECDREGIDEKKKYFCFVCWHVMNGFQIRWKVHLVPLLLI